MVTEPVKTTPMLTHLFAGEGEICTLLRSQDWSQTGFGAIEQWPSSLCTAVSLLCQSRSPMLLFWGEEYLILYNDAYRPLLAAEDHPAALGQGAATLWGNQWRQWRPTLDTVKQAGKAASIQGQHVAANHADWLLFTDLTYSLTPIWDEAGHIGGVFGTCTIAPATPIALPSPLPDLAPPHPAQFCPLPATEQAPAALLELCFKYVPNGIAMFDCDMRYLMASQRWIKDYNLTSVGAIVGRSHYDIFPEISDRWKAIHQRCLAGNIERCEMDQFEREDGSVQWLRWEIHPWYQLNQTIGGIIIFTEDITAWCETETALQESQRQLQAQLAEIETIYQSAPIGLNVLDTELRFVRINQRLANINGIPVEAHIGRTVRELLPELADAAERILCPILETGEPLLNVEIVGETPAQPGIQRVWLESFLPLKSGDRVIGISTVCEEITEHKQLEAARQQAEQELRQAKANLEIRVAERTAKLQEINAELHQSESTLRSFFNSDGILMAILELHDTDICYLSANRVVAEFLGKPPETLQNRFFSELAPPAACVQTWLEYCRTAHAQQTPLKFEYAYTHGDKTHWLFVNLCPIITSASGRPQFSVVAKDITDRKRAEAILAHREEQIRLTLEFTHIGTWEWDVQTGHTTWNDNHFRLMGLDPAIAISASDLYARWRNAIHPDDVESVEHALHHALATHTDYEAEYRVIHPDGSIHWLAGRGRGLYTPTGEPSQMLGVILDVSTHKQAEQTLELQAVITRNMAEGICLVRADNGNIIYANPKFEQMFGYDPGELNGRHVSIVNSAPDAVGAEAVNQAIRTAVLQQGEATYEVHNLKKDDTPFWCSATTSVFTHPEYGEVLVAVHQDISDRKQAAAQIAAALREKEVLLQEIHHRVKNNLGIVSGLLQMQARRIQAPEAKAILLDSQNRIASIALVHEKLYRSDDLAKVDLAQYLRELTIYLFDSYNVSSAQINLDIQVEPVNLDVEQAIPCGLIINELVSNALKHAFPGDRTGTIQVQLTPLPIAPDSAPATSFTLYVRDDGIGLPDNFNPQTSRTLGLSLVQGLVAQIDGRWEVHSQQGTEIRVVVGDAKHDRFNP